MLRSPLIRCFGFYRPHWRLLVMATLVTVVVNISMPLTMWLLGGAINDIRRVVSADPAQVAHAAWMWGLALVGLAVGRGLLQYVGTILAMAAGQRLLHDLRLAIFTQVQRLDLGWHRLHGSGEIVNRTTRDSDKVRDAVTGGFRTMLEMGVIFIAVLCCLWWYHPLLGLVPTVLVAIGLWLVARQAGDIARLDTTTSEAYDAVLQDLDEGVRGVRVIKSFSLEAPRAKRFAGHQGAFEALCLNAVGYIARHLPGPQLIVSAGHVWILGCGAWLVAGGAIEPGTLVAAMLMMQMIIFRIESVGNIQKMFAEARASAERIIAVLDAQPALRDGAARLPSGPIGLRFDGVTVAAPGGKAVLERLDLRIAPGEAVALVGATGSGKSTLAGLASRLADPDAGAVLAGSDAAGWTDLRRARLAEVRRRIQVVFQDSFLFSDSLAANLRRARPEATDDELRSALDLASAGEVLALLTDGLQGRIGERGATLSGGQRQRLCLARALVARPGILVADDSTSALDAVTEHRILDRLRAMGDGRPSMLLIASKLSTILLADRVVLLDGGRIAASGTHEELVAGCPAYRDLLGLDEAAA